MLVDEQTYIAIESRTEFWSTPELIVQQMSAAGSSRDIVDLDKVPEPLRFHDGPSIKLPVPSSDQEAMVSLRAVFERRKSTRTFSNAQLALADMSALIECLRLRHIDETTGAVFGRIPSSGARRPWDVYALVLNVADLTPGCYHVSGTDLGLVRLPHAAPLIDWLGRVKPPEQPAVALLIVTTFRRTMWKYQGFGLSLVDRDVGCVLQSLYLSATALNLAGYAVAAIPGVHPGMLRLDPIQHALAGAFLVGVPQSQTSR
jgi:SagB-type dehydrogenase family enzyme